MARPITVEIRDESVGANLVLAVDGELDIASVAVLAQPIDAHIGRGHEKALTLDLSEVSFMDSSDDMPTLHVSLERDPRAPSLARAAVAGFTENSELDPMESATLTLLVSELVSNAVLHSDAPPASGILLCARMKEDAVRVEVIDRGSGFTAAPRDPAQPMGGYGLYLVDQQATRWGVDHECGTCVWFELAQPARSS
jgi:anti-sigma regulatory factor (Ser/Thr protein kinase)